jgi:hypothetical protein
MAIRPHAHRLRRPGQCQAVPRSASGPKGHRQWSAGGDARRRGRRGYLAIFARCAPGWMDCMARAHAQPPAKMSPRPPIQLSLPPQRANRPTGQGPKVPTGQTASCHRLAFPCALRRSAGCRNGPRCQSAKVPPCHQPRVPLSAGQCQPPRPRQVTCSPAHRRQLSRHGVSQENIPTYGCRSDIRNRSTFTDASGVPANLRANPAGRGNVFELRATWQAGTQPGTHLF